MRFLPTQEWSSGGTQVYRQKIRLIVAARRMSAAATNNAKIYHTHTPVPHKTIPAKAGIYFLQAATPLNLGGDAAHG